mmetsp:Transcript_34995/g.98222  ORF Transcript_34995/g.98222 Transcript_34995/m.98222 type:complete len:607 (+) Transcript_34995:50-1870(+)
MWARTPGRPWCCVLVLRWLFGGGGLACEIELPQAYRAVGCEGTTTNSTCFVVCADGWTLKGGMQQVTCLASGAFSSELPVCEPNACASPVESPEINTTLCGSLTVGEACTVMCADGYAGNASNYTCLASGYLHGSVPRCEPRVCPVPDFQGLQHTCGSVRVGSDCSVFCDEGYECESGAVPRWECAWDPGIQGVVLRGEMPRCRPQPCEYNLPEGAMYEHNCTGVRTGDSCTWACAQNYQGTPTSHVCLPSRWLSIGNPSCSAATCPGLDDPRFAGSCSEDTPVGEACLAVCARGYRGFPTQLRCVLDGSEGAVSLQGGLPDCTPKACISGMPLGAQYDVDDCSGVTTHDVCTIQCAPGWEGAPANFTCNGDGHLEGAAPTCTQVSTTSAASTTFAATTALRTTTTTSAATSGIQPETTTRSESTSYRVTATVATTSITAAATTTSTATASTTETTSTPLSATDPAIINTSTTTTETSTTALNLSTPATATDALNLTATTTTTPAPNMTTSTSANSEIMRRAPVVDQKVVDVRRLAVMAAVLGGICSTVACGTFLYHLARKEADDDGSLVGSAFTDYSVEDEESITQPHATSRPVWCDWSRNVVHI